MKSRLESLYTDYNKALQALIEAVKEAKTDLEVEGTLKRFELFYELSWKLIKQALEILGIVCKNPRECFKQAVANGFIEEPEKWNAMIEDRNELIHTYNYEGSREMFQRVKDIYLPLFEHLKNSVEKVIKEVSL